MKKSKGCLPFSFLWKPNTDRKRNIFFLKRDKFYFQAEESRYG